jgi:hypothetical protein
MAELKPCPFCGGKPKLVHTKATIDTYQVGCFNDLRKCKVRPETIWYRRERYAITAWNRRGDK